MGMVIHDDYYEAAMQLPSKQRAAFLLAVVRYGFEGAEPQGSPPWLPVFTVIRGRIDMGAEASERGRRMARARWDKAAKPDAAKDAQAHAQAYAQASDGPDAEVEDEVEDEGTPYSPPSPSSEKSFSLFCLAELNASLGTAYSSLPSKAARTLARFEGSYSPAEVRAMVDYKRDEWRGTQWANCLTPNTLFGPDHFEQYLHQSMAARKEADDHAKYARDDNPFS